MKDVFEQLLTVEYPISLDLFNRTPITTKCRGLAFTITTNLLHCDTANPPARAYLVKLRISVVAENLVSVDMSSPAKKVGDFDFVVANFPCSPLPLKVIFKFTPKLRNYQSIAQNIEIPYTILKDLNFGEYYEHFIPLPNTPINLKAKWTPVLNPTRKIEYQLYIDGKPGVKIENCAGDYFYNFPEKNPESLFGGAFEGRISMNPDRPSLRAYYHPIHFLIDNDAFTHPPVPIPEATKSIGSCETFTKKPKDAQPFSFGTLPPMMISEFKEACPTGKSVLGFQ